MAIQATYNSLRLIAGLGLLAALLAAAPAHARAAGAVLCNANPAGMNRALRAQDSTPHQAGLVIDFGDGRVMTFCIDLGADGQATGEELLRASNLPVVLEYSGGIGGAVCKIDTVGSDFPAEPCFSHCTLRPGETCMYWSYSQLVGDHWQFSQIGASSTVVRSGDVNGWAWGESTIARGAQPPLRTLADICLPATATPTASLTPTPSATATATLPPAAAPPATTTPYVAKIITATPTASPKPTSTTTTSPVVAPPMPPSAQAQAAAPTALPALSPPTPTPQPPTIPPSVTALPPTTSVAPPTPPPAKRDLGGNLRIQLPLIQQAVAATPSATTRPTARPAARMESVLATPLSATPAPATATPPPPGVPDDNPTRNYPYFGVMTIFLLGSWALLRRGRRAP
jgi:hypothetical protein